MERILDRKRGAGSDLSVCVQPVDPVPAAIGIMRKGKSPHLFMQSKKFRIFCLPISHRGCDKRFDLNPPRLIRRLALEAGLFSVNVERKPHSSGRIHAQRDMAADDPAAFCDFFRLSLVLKNRNQEPHTFDRMTLNTGSSLRGIHKATFRADKFQNCVFFRNIKFFQHLIGERGSLIGFQRYFFGLRIADSVIPASTKPST